MAKVLLNAFYLQGQGKLQNAPGYIRAGIEDGYDLLPQVASRLEGRRRELEAQLRLTAITRAGKSAIDQKAAEEAAIAYVLEQLGPAELEHLVAQAVGLLPEPLIRQTLPFPIPSCAARCMNLLVVSQLTSPGMLQTRASHGRFLPSSLKCYNLLHFLVFCVAALGHNCDFTACYISTSVLRSWCPGTPPAP